MLRALFLVAVVALCVCVVPSLSESTPDQPAADASRASTTPNPCGCSSAGADRQSLEGTSEVALQDTTTTVCLAYVWFNHGSYCSWYSWECPYGGPLNVNSTNCGINGNCSTPMPPGCLVMAPATGGPGDAKSAALTVSNDPFLGDPLHPGKQGYKGDKHQKKNKLDKPKDKNLKVTQLDEDHVRFTYPTASGAQKTVHAQIFRTKVSHKLHPEKDEGDFSIGYEIEEPASNGSPTDIPDADVTATGPFCVTVTHKGAPVDIILHEHSSPTNYVEP